MINSTRPPLLLGIIACSLASTSCKDEVAEARIKVLEETISQLESANRVLEDDLAKNRKEEGSLGPDAVQLLKERVTSLEEEVKRLGPYEVKAKDAAEELEMTKMRLASATLVPALRNKDAAAAADMRNAVEDKSGGVATAVSNSVLIIEGDKSVGTGFMAKVDDKIYFYTAAHVLSGNSKLTVKNASGKQFTKFGNFEYAEGADMVRMAVTEPVEEYLEIVPSGVDFQIQTEIAALGNGGGTGVVAMEKGRIMGTSGDSVEVDAGIIKGNSGGPIVHLESGKVVGLVTHLTAEQKDIWSEGTRQAEVRRFACRMNKQWEWKTVRIGGFLNEAKALNEYDELTRLCYAIAALEPLTTGMRLDVNVGNGTETAVAIFDRNKDKPLVKAIVKMNSELAARRLMLSESDLKKRFRSILGETISMAQRNNAGFKAEEMSWFHRSRATSSVEARTDVLKLLDDDLANLK